jgi:hypothetical protein
MRKGDKMVNLIDESKCKFLPVDKLAFIRAAAKADMNHSTYYGVTINEAKEFENLLIIFEAGNKQYIGHVTRGFEIEKIEYEKWSDELVNKLYNKIKKIIK